MFERSDTYQYIGFDDVDDHLWFVASDVARDSERIVVANFTSKRANSDLSCELGRDDHPWIRHETVVAYGRSRILSLSDLVAATQSGFLEKRTPLPTLTLDKVMLGFSISEETPIKCLKVLISQGLIPPIPGI